MSSALKNEFFDFPFLGGDGAREPEPDIERGDPVPSCGKRGFVQRPLPTRAGSHWRRVRVQGSRLLMRIKRRG